MDLMNKVIEQSQQFFELPMHIKQKYNKGRQQPPSLLSSPPTCPKTLTILLTPRLTTYIYIYAIDLLEHNYNRGYEGFRSQNFEKRGAGDLKEGFSIGIHKEPDHADVQNRIFGQGPNTYPAEMSSEFRTTMEAYFEAADALSRDLLRALALTLGLKETYFDRGFCQQPVVELMRLLHYPPQPVDASVYERGIGAHTDFGSVTILMQDNKGYLTARLINPIYTNDIYQVVSKSGTQTRENGSMSSPNRAHW